MNYYRFISRNEYQTQRIFYEGNRDATPKRDTRSHCGLLLIYQAMYCRARYVHISLSRSPPCKRRCV